MLIVGEIYVDLSGKPGESWAKPRLGGIVHAARGLCAIQKPFAVAAICPEYLRDISDAVLEQYGCTEFIDLGNVSGSPNIMTIKDLLETGDQEYEDILCEKKSVTLNDVGEKIKPYSDVLVFPGKFSLNELCKMLPKDARLNFDIAYDIEDPKDLIVFSNIQTIFSSTSSELFFRKGKDNFERFVASLNVIGPKEMALKENRGGLRIFRYDSSDTVLVPAKLGITKTSVGAGDVFSATYVALSRDEDRRYAPYKAMHVSSAYAQTLDMDDLKRRVDLSFRLPGKKMKDLRGTFLPWHNRPDFSIYLAAPDFSIQDREEIDSAIHSLEHHNFRVRRPILENKELSSDAGIPEFKEMYYKDISLIDECSLMFAIPKNRDSGTLVEIGLAIEKRMPVIVFDPNKECFNPMVVGGAECYSQNLDECLNAVFATLSDKLSDKLEEDS